MQPVNPVLPGSLGFGPGSPGLGSIKTLSAPHYKQIEFGSELMLRHLSSGGFSRNIAKVLMPSLKTRWKDLDGP